MRFGWQAIYLKPGGWPYSAGNAPQLGKPVIKHSVREPLKPRDGIIIVLFLILMIVQGGLGFPLQLLAVFLLPILVLFAGRIVRVWMFGNVPANEASVFPKDEDEDYRRRYAALMITLTMLWIQALVAALFCNWVLKNALGDDFAFFAEHPTLQKGASQSNYFIFLAIMAVQGALALSGLLWLPMYAFFERLEMQRRIRALGLAGKSGGKYA